MKGVVKEIEDNLCRFLLANGVYVYIWNAIGEDGVRIYPKISSEVAFTKYYQYKDEDGKVVFILLKSKEELVKFPYRYKIERNEFALALKNRPCHKLVWNFHKNVKQVEEAFQNDHFNAVELFPFIFDVESLTEGPPYTLTSPCNHSQYLNYLEVKVKKEDENLPAWMWGLHRSKEHEKIMGVLTLNHNSPSYNIELIDTKTSLTCLLIGNTSDIFYYLNRFVIIESFVVFSETYNGKSESEPEKTQIFEYIMFSLKHVKLLALSCTLPLPIEMNVKQKLFPSNEYKEKNPRKNKLKFKIEKISRIRVKNMHQQEFQVEALNLNTNLRIILVFRNEYVALTNLLHRKFTYNLYYDRLFVVKLEKGVLKFIVQQPGAYLARFAFVGDEEEGKEVILPDLSKVPLSSLSSEGEGVQRISFAAWIQDKHVESNGKYSLSLKLLNGGNKEKSVVHLLLGNWIRDREAQVLGLLPYTYVLFRDVLLIKGELQVDEYTSFKPVMMNKHFLVSSAKRIESKDWGLPQSLRYGNNLPLNMFLVFELTMLEIVELKVYAICSECKSKKKPGKKICGFCATSNDSNQCKFKMMAFGGNESQYGFFKFADAKILRRLFRFDSDSDFLSFKEDFTNREFSYKKPFPRARKKVRTTINDLDLEEEAKKPIGFKEKFKDAIAESNFSRDLFPGVLVYCLKENENRFYKPVFRCLDVRF